MDALSGFSFPSSFLRFVNNYQSSFSLAVWIEKGNSCFPNVPCQPLHSRPDKAAIKLAHQNKNKNLQHGTSYEWDLVCKSKGQMMWRRKRVVKECGFVLMCAQFRVNCSSSMKKHVSTVCIGETVTWAT
jgi:hypothetical protein